MLRFRELSEQGGAMIDKQLLDILACPSCQSGVLEREGKIVCQNSACGLKYPIRDGIPVMLIDEAEK